jgi:hypothetical protein
VEARRKMKSRNFLPAALAPARREALKKLLKWRVMREAEINYWVDHQEADEDGALCRKPAHPNSSGYGTASAHAIRAGATEDRER